MQQTSQEQRIAYLEFVNDQLESELTAVDALLRAVGFEEGLSTLKAAAQELVESCDA